MKGLVRISLIATASLWGTALHAGPAPSDLPYYVTISDLGTMGGRSSEAADINDAGNIVGWSQTYAEVKHAFFYRAGIFNDVGASRWSTPSYATGLNNLNVVVGNLQQPGNKNLAFRWYEGALTELRVTTSPHALVGTTAEAISDAGFIAGTRDYPDFGYYFQLATVWTDDVTFHTLDVPGTPWSSSTNDISAGGLVVGRADDPVRWQFNPAVSATPFWIVPTTRPGCDVQVPLGINRWGSVVGYVACPGPAGVTFLRAMLWNGWAPSSQDIDPIPGGTRSIAYDINDTHVVVGAAGRRVSIPGTTRTGETNRAFIYRSDFGLQTLPTLPGTVGLGECQALALNNLNNRLVIQVVGFCHTGDEFSPRHAVRWNVTLVRR